MTITIENNNSGNYANDKVHIAVLGRLVKDGPYNRLKADGTFSEISTADNTIEKHFLDGSVAKDTFANYFFTLADLQAAGKTSDGSSTGNPMITLSQHLESARMYVALDDWLPIKVNGSSAYSPPSPTNPSLPGYQTIYDKIEFTYQPDADATANKVFINTTSVDFMGIPLTLSMEGTSRGYTSKRAALISKFSDASSYYSGDSPTDAQKAALANFSALVIPSATSGTPDLRVLSPEHAMNTVMSAQQVAYFNAYFDSYINAIWAYYDKNGASPQTLNLSIANQKYTGEVDGGVFNFYAGDSISGSVVLALSKPSTMDVLNCNNTMDSGTDVQKNIEKFIAAAINRSVLKFVAPGSGDSWCGASGQYYKNDPVHYYCQILHNNSIDSMCYAFGYDDVCDQSSTLKTKDKDVAVTLGIDAW